MDRKRMVWDSVADIVLGIWLIVAPLVFGYGFVGSAVWNGLFVGTLVVLLAGLSALALFSAPSWVNAVLGGWLVISPLLLAYAAAPELLWNSMIVGLLLIVLSWRSATAR